MCFLTRRNWKIQNIWLKIKIHEISVEITKFIFFEKYNFADKHSKTGDLDLGYRGIFLSPNFKVLKKRPNWFVGQKSYNVYLSTFWLLHCKLSLFCGFFFTKSSISALVTHLFRWKKTTIRVIEQKAIRQKGIRLQKCLCYFNVLSWIKSVSNRK